MREHAAVNESLEERRRQRLQLRGRPAAAIMHEQRVNLPESVFNKVSRPARYTGNEWNSVTKPWERVSLRVALCYPDVYEVGMSNLALPVLYEMLNAWPDVLAERVFPPWPDMESLLRSGHAPLRSLESGRPLDQFDVVAFSLGYELTYTNVLTVLDLGRIPLLQRERTRQHPLVIAGGSCAVNPEPMADFVDLFFIGEAEDGLAALTDCMQRHREDRAALLKAAARIESVSSAITVSFIALRRSGRFSQITATPCCRWVSMVS